MRAIKLLGCAAAIATVLSGPAFSQGAPQTLATMKVNPLSLATGHRASKEIGTNVFNESNVSVGTIDDLIVTPGDNVSYAVLSVGGFLGMDAKLVAVPYNTLEIRNKQMVLPGATKDSLKALPTFKYNS